MDNENMVIVPIKRYEELIIIERRYNDIVNAALKGAGLSSWNDELCIDDDSVERYLQIAERDRFNSVRHSLLQKREAARVENVHIEEGEV